MRLVLSVALTAVLSAPVALAQTAPPVEPRGANAPRQAPAFAGQTRAPASATMPAMTGEVVADDLPALWALEFLPDGRMLVTASAFVPPAPGLIVNLVDAARVPRSVGVSTTRFVVIRRP